MSIIKENWKHIEEIEQAMKEKTGDKKAGFNRSLFFFGERQLLIPCEHKKITSKGESKKTYTKLVRAEYCPFSGLPLYKD